MSEQLPLSKAAFARSCGFARSRLTKLTGEGLPVRPDGKIDPVAARRWMEKNLDHARRDRWGGPASSVKPKMGGARADTDGATLSDARRDREISKAAREALQLRRDRGELIEKAAVRRFLEARGRLERDAALAWTSRVSAVLAAEIGIDPRRLHTRLEAEMRQHLRDLADTPLTEQEIIRDHDDVVA
jgi:hypothetical protein